MKRRILCMVSAFLLIGVLAVPCFATNTPLDSAPWQTIDEFDIMDTDEYNYPYVNRNGSGLYMTRLVITLNGNSEWWNRVIMGEFRMTWNGALFEDHQSFTMRLPNNTNNGEPVCIYQLAYIDTSGYIDFFFKIAGNSFGTPTGSCHVKVQMLRYDDWTSESGGSYQDGYNEGLINGRTEGYNSGYNVGYEEGETVGYTNGYNDGYDIGLGDGSDNSAVVGEAIEGYFSGVIAFLNIFMGLGIGALTVGNLIGLAVVTLVVILIIRIIRG